MARKSETYRGARRNAVKDFAGKLCDLWYQHVRSGDPRQAKYTLQRSRVQPEGKVYTNKGIQESLRRQARLDRPAIIPDWVPLNDVI